MTILASHTLSKLFCTCPAEPPFLAVLSVKDLVPLHVLRHPVHGTWSPNAQVCSPLCDAWGCRAERISPQELWPTQRPCQTNQDWVSFSEHREPHSPVPWVPSACRGLDLAVGRSVVQELTWLWEHQSEAVSAVQEQLPCFAGTIVQTRLSPPC